MLNLLWFPIWKLHSMPQSLFFLLCSSPKIFVKDTMFWEPILLPSSSRRLYFGYTSDPYRQFNSTLYVFDDGVRLTDDFFFKAQSPKRNIIFQWVIHQRQSPIVLEVILSDVIMLFLLTCGIWWSVCYVCQLFLWISGYTWEGST